MYYHTGEEAETSLDGGPNDVPWSVADAFKALGLLLLLNVLMAIFLAAFLFITGSREITPVQSSLISLGTVAGTFLLVWFFTIKKYHSRLWQLGIQKSPILILIPIIALTEFIVLIVENLYATILFALTKIKAPTQDIVKLFGHSPAGIVFAFVIVVILAPASEELFFRGFVYAALRKNFGVTAGMISSAAIFAVFHLNLLLFLPIFILAVALAWLYESRKSLLAPFLLHALNNLVALLYLYLKK